MAPKFDGIAFDLDGTLYPNYQFYFRLLPFIIKEHRLLIALGKARDLLRGGAGGDFPADRFYDVQARLMAECLGGRPDPAAVKDKTERLIYRGWEPLFKKIPLYPHVLPVLREFREQGIALGLLSDFPPDIKIDYLGLSGLWDVQLCSEVLGALKPDPVPFRILAEKMGLPPERILYVGNSVSYDAAGARGAGMKAALITPPFLRKYQHNRADFVFSGYRQLSAWIARSTTNC
ncbi:phosphoglycolate phosphatase [Spirochaetia bacterium]|nr:phosphoglycolate phosphatase [Spirochaetia bacterium]